MPTFQERHGLKSFIVAPTAVIRGVGVTAGMEIRGDKEVPGMTGYYDSNLEGKCRYAASICHEYDFGFVHVKGVDDAGHDKSLKIKVEQIEKSDKAIGVMIKDLQEKPFDTIICVTGDHTTPVKYGDHSHEPVPIVLGTVKTSENLDASLKFDEITCSKGRLGRFAGSEIVPLLLKYRSKLQS